MILTIFPAIALIVMAIFTYKSHTDLLLNRLLIGIIILLLCFIVTPIMISQSIKGQIEDVETWGGWVTQARYYEPWNRYVHKICTRTTKMGKTTITQTYDCSYVEYHPAEYVLDDSNGEESEISEEEFEYLCKKFGNKKFRELNRQSYTIDGDLYYTKWDGSEPSFTKFFTQHEYINRTKSSSYASHKVDPTGLYEYPKFDKWNDVAILGNYNNSLQANEILKNFNAKNGASKQIKLYILLFSQNIEIAKRQKIFWENGNKNEFVLCLGVKDGRINWVDHFCWSPDGHTGNDMIGLGMREFVGQEADIVKIAETLTQKTNTWKRKDFDELNYIEVEESSLCKWLCFCLNSLGSIAILCVPIFNKENRYDSSFRISR